MECLICGKDAKYRTVKGNPVCKDCTSQLRETRDHLNRTRRDPVIKSLGSGTEDAVTLREIVVKASLQKALKENEVVVNENT
jgi:hypothetical protein